MKQVGGGADEAGGAQQHVLEAGGAETQSGKEEDGGFTTRLTKEQLYALRQVRNIEKLQERQMRAEESGGTGRSEGMLSATFYVEGSENPKTNGGFNQDLFVPVFIALKGFMPKAEPRVTKNGKLEIKVHTQDELSSLFRWEKLKVLKMKAYGTTEMPLWGSIEGVHHQLPEGVLGEELKKQGVCEVRRVQRSVRLFHQDGTKYEKRNTERVDIRFESAIRGTVMLWGESYEVTLKGPHPMQCTKCLRYNHKKDECRETSELCARCGEAGHMSKACTKSPRCLNCHLPHSALSQACGVYKAWSNVASSNYVSKVMRKTESTVQIMGMQKFSSPKPVDESQGATPAAASQGQTWSQSKSPTFAEITQRSLVMTDSTGATQVVCKIPQDKTPLAGLRKPQHKAEVVRRDNIPSPRDGPNERAEKAEATVRQLKEKTKKIWKMVTAVIKTLGSRFPEIRDLIDALGDMSDIITEF